MLPDTSWIPTEQGFAFQYILSNGLTKLPFMVWVENSNIHWKSTGFRLKGAWAKTVQRSLCKYKVLEILSFQWLPWKCQGLSKLLLLNTCTFNQACCHGQNSVLVYKNWWGILRVRRDISHWIPLLVPYLSTWLPWAASGREGRW